MTILLLFFGICTTFYLIAKICDTHFMDSLEAISNRLKLSSDVAGATFMAMGSSAPELFTAIVALMKVGAETVGVGTIVGSALFNLLVIVGASCLVASMVIRWRSVMRDILFYLASVILLLIAFQDGIISTLEASICVGLYALYIIVLMNWKRIDPVLEHMAHTETEVEKVEHWFHDAAQKIIDIAFLMVHRKPHFYPIKFLISIFYIGFLSWGLVELAILLAAELEIPKAIVALTVLAAGTSIPDLLSSISASKRGHGTMAVSNAIGSNTFNILIGLGLPWLIYNLIQDQKILVESGSIADSALILFATVAAFLIWIIVQKFHLGKWSGMLLIGTYAGYLGYVIGLVL